MQGCLCEMEEVEELNDRLTNVLFVETSEFYLVETSAFGQ